MFLKLIADLFRKATTPPPIPSTDAEVLAMEAEIDAVPAFDGPLERIPRNRAEVYATFGNPGTGHPDPAWEKANIVEKRDLPGVPHKWYFQCHRLVEPYIREALRRALLADPDYEIVTAASYVFRHQRHDPKRPLSYHSWGIAFDIDPSLNSGKTFDVKKTPPPWSKEWRKHWPKGLSQEFVEAVESVGFAWGGRWRGYIDPMHFEFVGKSTAQV